MNRLAGINVPIIFSMHCLLILSPEDSITSRFIGTVGAIRRSILGIYPFLQAVCRCLERSRYNMVSDQEGYSIKIIDHSVDDFYRIGVRSIGW